MIVPDVNLLLYAEIDAFAEHAASRRWLEDALNGERPVGIAPVVLFGFLRIATNRRVFREPLAIDDAIARARCWLDQPGTTCLIAGHAHFDIAVGLLSRSGAAGNLTTDAQIAAHAIEHGGEVHSNDSDFARFQGLRWLNPLS
ncbi:MAG: type II toxin-antitoxin system VapC family toxin [Myxococcales bacterium]|nr:type II toxin-antitoxin system VapC family toxin [Myxococcales bacterium]MDD9969613.1 type II toxin-antitoxin system VapC family toxin [Myxococcales bacterium]